MALLKRPWIAVDGGKMEVVSIKSVGGATVVLCPNITKALRSGDGSEAAIFLNSDVVTAIIKASGRD